VARQAIAERRGKGGGGGGMGYFLLSLYLFPSQIMWFTKISGSKP